MVEAANEFSLDMLAYCGLYCDQCSFRVASLTADRNHVLSMPGVYDKQKENTLEEWFCPGCKGENICGDCAIKDCAIEKKLDSCADCTVFPCEKLHSFSQDGVPHHKEALENLLEIRRVGQEAWFDSYTQSHHCSCGERQSWYYKCSTHSR